jgi:hypothetical protein
LFQSEILESTTKFVIAGDIGEIRIEAEGLQHACVHTERNGWIALLDATQGFPGDTRPLRDCFSGVSPAQPSLTQPITKAGKFPVEAGKQGGGGSWHMGNNLPKVAGKCPIYDPLTPLCRGWRGVVISGDLYNDLPRLRS